MTELTKKLRECREKYGPDDPRTKAAFFARVAEVEAAEPRQPGVWYFSFANETGFLGGAFVYADSFSTALALLSVKKANPGGEVEGMPPNEKMDQVPERWRNRLLSKEELEQLTKEMKAVDN